MSEIKLSPLKIEILEILLNAKKAGNPFVYLQGYRRGTLIYLRDNLLIFASNSTIDKTRYSITSKGEKALLDASKPVLKYWYNGNGYPTIQALADGENMSFDQARYRVRKGYQSKRDMKHNAPVIVAGKLYENVNDAATKLGYLPKSIRRIIARERQQGIRTIKRSPEQSIYYKRYRLKKRLEQLRNGQ